MPQEPLHIEDINGTADDYRVLRLNGPVTISNFFQFQSLVRGNTSRKLILDLSGVPYIDSAGIGALVGAYVNHQKDGRSLALVGVSKRGRDALQVTRVEQFFKFFDTEDNSNSMVPIPIIRSDPKIKIPTLSQTARQGWGTLFV